MTEFFNTKLDEQAKESFEQQKQIKAMEERMKKLQDAQRRSLNHSNQRYQDDYRHASTHHNQLRRLEHQNRVLLNRVEALTRAERDAINQSNHKQYQLQQQHQQRQHFRQPPLQQQHNGSGGVSGGSAAAAAHAESDPTAGAGKGSVQPSNSSTAGAGAAAAAAAATADDNGDDDIQILTEISYKEMYERAKKQHAELRIYYTQAIGRLGGCVHQINQPCPV